MYDFPSKKREENFPLIRLAPDTGNDFINWFHDHTEIERRIPPIYQDFVIEHKAGKITYRKLSWSVRGHYRHCGMDKKLKYIQPQIRSRNGKITGKPQRTTYTVESPEKKQ